EQLPKLVQAPLVLQGLPSEGLAGAKAQRRRFAQPRLVIAAPRDEMARNRIIRHLSPSAFLCYRLSYAAFELSVLRPGPSLWQSIRTHTFCFRGCGSLRRRPRRGPLRGRVAGCARTELACDMAVTFYLRQQKRLGRSQPFLLSRVPTVGFEPTWAQGPQDFKSRASTVPPRRLTGSL